MPFRIPPMSELLKAANQLEITYAEIRKEKDSNRFLGSIRPATYNSDRINDMQFIKTLAQHISDNKANYSNVDASFKGQDYALVVAPFLKEALSGALLLDLLKITRSYKGDETSVKKNSALGNVILDLFKIDGLSEVPLDKQKKCLEALKTYIQIYDAHAKANNENPIQWHGQRANTELRKIIEREIKTIIELEAQNNPHNIAVPY
ncbi:hypothetical protein [Legionella jamestowniensis]|uniref:Substrate of the Dot/Icm secretion system n=1 Tax=Legionella jamestowniensis TaxID=455 RepID=A0A0W0UHR6_9GAMM|nr:hypothetical protein [Legionella jamestowniensis]KTD07451.1 hypothetical protein Ljam_1646 [Legionella jamestowniensis]SFM00293.1 hypothetical protein SAMN02746073_2974 [Legionella jamestowniensis DSM 19215]